MNRMVATTTDGSRILSRKHANMLFSLSLRRETGGRGIVSVSLHPGVIFTNLSRDLGQEDFGELGEQTRCSKVTGVIPIQVLIVCLHRSSRSAAG